MPPTRISIFTNQFPGKVSTFFSRDIFTLIKFGYEVDIFSVYPIHEENWRFVPENYRRTIQSSAKIIHITPFHLFKINPKVKDEALVIIKESMKYGKTQLAKSLYVIQQAILWSKRYEGKYDLMLSYWGNYAATYAYLASKSCEERIPFSFFLHAGTDLYRDQIFLEQKIQCARNVFTVCDFNVHFLKSLYPLSFESFKNKIIVHHLGIDLQELEYHPFGRDPFTLLTIGSLLPQKGFVNVIEALAKLQKEFEDLNLIMIGEGTEKENLVRKARTLGIRNRITFIDQLPFEQVIYYLQKCTILIHPSNDLGDAVPTVIKEALASGLPVIGSDLAGIPELLDFGNAGVLFPPNDISALVDAIRMLLHDEPKRYQLAKNGRLFAEKKFDMWKNGKSFAQQLISTDNCYVYFR